MQQKQTQILFKGIKRNIPESQYSKIKQFPYHQMLSPRFNLNETSRVQQSSSNSRLKDIRQDEYDEVQKSFKKMIRDLSQNITCLEAQNEALSKQIKKNSKIERIMPKMCVGAQPKNGPDQLKKYQQFLLALETIELEQKLCQKIKIYNELSMNGRKAEQKYKNLNASKASLIQSLFLDRLLPQKIEKSMEIFYKVDQKLAALSVKSKDEHKKISNRLKLIKRQKKNELQNLSELNYLCCEKKQEVEEIELKRIRKDPSEFIETRGGQMKNVDELEREIQQLHRSRKNIYERLETQMQEKIAIKIKIRNEIQRLMDLHSSKQFSSQSLYAISKCK